MNCAFCGFAASPRSAVTCILCGKELERAKDALPRGRRGPSMRYEEGWKRFLLVRIGASPLELTPGETLTIGRSKSCDLTIPSQRVSRTHAEVFWRSKQPVIKDLGSENGTLINGKAVREHELVDDDEIRVGPYSCAYRCVNGRGSVGKILEKLDSRAETATIEADLRGDIEQVSLIEVLGLLDRVEKTGSLEVFEADCEDGRIVFEKGVPLFAQVGDDLLGRGAVLRLLAQERGKFRFEDGLRDVERNIEERSVTELVIEHGLAVDRRHTNRRDLTNLGDLEDSDDGVG